MAETTTTTHSAPTATNGQFVRPHNPVNTANLKPDTLTLKIDSNTANTGITKDKKPAKQQKFDSVEQEVLYLEEASKRGLLTIEDATRLKNLREELQDKNDNEAVTDQNKDDDVRSDDPDRDKFAEMDVIKYMYEKWLLALGEEMCFRMEKGLNRAWETSYRRHLQNKAMATAETKAYHGTTTYKTKESIVSKVKEKSDNLLNNSKQEIGYLPKITTKIGDGTLFDLDGNGHFSPEAAQFAKYIGALTPEGKIDTTNPGWQKMAEKFQHKKNMKEAGDEKGFKQSAAELRKIGSKFITSISRQIQYDTKRDIAALQMTGAMMIDQIARDSHCFDSQGIDKSFDQMLKQNSDLIKNKTNDERNAFVQRPIQGLGIFNNPDLDSMSEAARQMSLSKRRSIAEAMGLTQAVMYGSLLNRYNHLSNSALSGANHVVESRRVQECGKTPPPIPAIKKLDNNLRDGTSSTYVAAPAPTVQQQEPQSLREAATPTTEERAAQERLRANEEQQRRVTEQQEAHNKYGKELKARTEQIKQARANKTNGNTNNAQTAEKPQAAQTKQAETTAKQPANTANVAKAYEQQQNHGGR